MLIIEGIAFSFWLLLVCVVGIANGTVNMVVFYEKEVKDRVVELGLITKEKINRNSKITALALFVPMLVGIPYMVYGINGVRNFKEAFFQMCVILLIGGLFDRIFIDWYWVNHTKAWIIEGTEDLMPYIYGKTLVRKWLGTLVGFPLLALLIACIMRFIIN